MNPVVHFEMPYDDQKRLNEFYSQAFGWQMQPLGDQMFNYVIATTTERDPKTNFPKRVGAINGGFFPADKTKPALAPSIVIAVDNLEAAMAKVVAAGGKILGEPVMIPGNGRYVSLLDTEGNRLSIIEPSPMK